MAPMFLPVLQWPALFVAILQGLCNAVPKSLLCVQIWLF